MKNARVSRCLLLATLGLGISGCQNCFHRTPTPPVPPPTTMTVPPCNQVPPAGAAQVYPPIPQTAPGAPYPQVPSGTEIRRYEPPVALPSDAKWGPAPFSQEPARENVRLRTPDLNRPEPAKPGTDAAQSTPSLPVGIPQFATAKEHVAAGLKPLLDGLDWLKENGFRAVLHIRQPGEDDVADRRQVEKRGLKYISLEVSPATLSKTIVDEFNRQVADTANLPLFVYDKDGALAGGLWYLHFRTVDRATDAEARTKAASLGLRDTQAGDMRLMWLAIQKYLGVPNI